MDSSNNSDSSIGSLGEFNTTFLNSPSSPLNTTFCAKTPSLKDMCKELQALRQENFQLKLRIHLAGQERTHTKNLSPLCRAPYNTPKSAPATTVLPSLVFNYPSADSSSSKQRSSSSTRELPVEITRANIDFIEDGGDDHDVHNDTSDGEDDQSGKNSSDESETEQNGNQMRDTSVVEVDKITGGDNVEDLHKEINRLNGIIATLARALRNFGAGTVDLEKGMEKLLNKKASSTKDGDK